MPTRTPYTSTALEVLTSANFEKMPKGWIGYAATATATTGVTTEVDLTDLSVTVTVGASRLIVIQGYIERAGSTVANDRALVVIKESTTTLQQAYVDLGSTTLASTGGTFVYIETDPITPSAGSHTYKMTGQRASGTGNVDFQAGSTAKSWIRVVDLGPSS